MKQAPLNSQPSLDQLFKRSSNASVPEVNVRERVRAALSQEGIPEGESSVAEVIDNWFSGIRGGVIAGIMAAVLIASGAYANLEFQEWSAESQVDVVESFILADNWGEESS
jgi:hypothetical protein